MSKTGKTVWYQKNYFIDAIAWAKKASMMGAEILLTSIDADGTKDGYEITLTKAVSKAVSVPSLLREDAALYSIWQMYCKILAQMLP